MGSNPIDRTIFITGNACRGAGVFLLLFRSAGLCLRSVLFFRGDGVDSAGQAHSSFDAGPGGDEQSTGGSDFIQIVQHFDLHFAQAQHITLTGQVACFGRLAGGIGVQSFVAVGRSLAFFVDIFESGQRPAREVFAAN